MKIRQGFVSNSSSSSFVVVFPFVPTTVEDVADCLFTKHQNFFPRFNLWGKSVRWTKQEVAKHVFAQIQSQIPTDKEKIIEEFRHYHDKHPPFDYDTEYEVLSGEDRDEMDKYLAQLENYQKEQAEEFIKDSEGQPIFVFEFSDNDGELMSAMEHGGTFDCLHHIRFSKH